MGFLFPAILWALPLALLPVAIHLFNLQRPKKVLFPNLRFLKEVIETEKSSRNLKYYLILLTRVLALLLLILAFARPVLDTTSGNSNLGLPTAFFVDNSASMGVNAGSDKSNFDLALSEVERKVSAYDPSQKILLTTYNPSVESRYFYNPKQIVDDLRGLEITQKDGQSLPSLNRILNSLEKESGRKKGKIFWYSDFQKSNYTNWDKLAVPNEAQIELVPLANTSNEGNVYVDSVFLISPIIRKGEKNTLYVRFKCKGGTESKKVSTKVMFDETLIGGGNVELPPNGELVQKFDFIPIQSDSTIKGVVTLDDLPVNYDNTFYFCLNPTKIVDVYIQNLTTENYCYTAFNNEKLFKVSQNKSKNVDFQKLNKADIVLIEGATDDFLTSASSALASYLNKGGTLVVFPSGGAKLTAINTLANGISIIPDTIKKIVALPITLPDKGDRFFDGVFEKQERNINLPEALPRFMVSGGKSILKFQNGTPFLSKYSQKAGALFFFNSDYTSEKSNWQRHSLFVPILFRIAFSSIKSVEKTYYKEGDGAIEVMVEPSTTTSKKFELKGGNQTLLLNARKIENRLLFELPVEFGAGGHYRILRNDSLISTVALNTITSESDFSFYTKDELRSLFNGKENISVAEPISEEGIGVISSITSGEIPLWKWLLVIGLGLILIEIFLLKQLKF